MKFLRFILLFLIVFIRPVLADQLFIGSDTNIVDGYYSGNASSGGYQCGICVTSNNSGQPWDVAVTGNINAYYNRANLWVSSSGNAYFYSSDSNKQLILHLSMSEGDAGINNEGGKLEIDGGTAGGQIFVGNVSYSNAIGLENFSSGGNTLIKNMDIYADSSSASSTYAIGVNNQAKYRFWSDMDNTFSFNKNYSKGWVAGLYSASRASAPTAEFEFIGMNLSFQDNYAVGGNNYGIATADLDLFGTESGNVYNYSYNEASNIASALYVWSGGSDINIKNMDIIIEENKGARFAGIFLGTDGSLNIEGNANSGQVSFINNKALSSDFVGVYALANTNVSFQNVDVLINKNSSIGTSAGFRFENGAAISSNEASNRKIEISENESQSAFYAFYTEKNLSLTNMDLIIKNNSSLYGDSIGIFANGSVSLTSLSKGIIDVSQLDYFLYASNASINVIENYNVSLKDVELFAFLRNSSSLNVKSSNVVFQDSGGILVDKSSMIIPSIKFEDSFLDANGGFFLKATTGSEADIELNNSQVFGRIVDGERGVINYSLFNNSLWQARSSAVISRFVLDNSTVDLTSLNGNNVLKVENYTATNGKIKLKSFLNSAGDKSDKLVVTQSSSGNTVLYIDAVAENESRSGKNDGVLVVEQDGASASADFTLYGGVIDSGLYEYTLQKGDLDGNGDNYYLRAQDSSGGSGGLSPVAKTSLDVPSVHLSAIKFGMNELRKRLGELREVSPSSKEGAWVRTYAKKVELDDHAKVKMDLYGFESGYDYNVYSSYGNKYYIGGMFGYLYTGDIKIEQHNNKEGSGKIKTPNFGAYGTWLGNEGYFADVSLRYFLSDMNVKNKSSQETDVSYESNRNYFAGEAEFGKRWNYALNSKEQFVFEPKAVLAYIYSKGGHSKNKNGIMARYSETTSKIFKNAITIYYQNKMDNGLFLEPFIQLGFAHDFDGKSTMSFSEVEIDSSAGGTTVEFGGGLNAKIDSRWSLYSDIMYETGSIVDALSVNLGVRYSF
ncbi:MAG: autotransporter outer membrane beta-barrel domain-containing protein [Alphaproteobacteria bacterium]